MKWTERQPVKAGDVVWMKIGLVGGHYRTLRDAPDAMDLRLCDLVSVKYQEDQDG